MAAQGVWVSDGPDKSVKGIFTTELLASRHALEHGLTVMFWPFGMSRDEAVAADAERKAKLTKTLAIVRPKPKAVS